MTPRLSSDKPWPTEAELDILQVLWEKGPCTVREVHEALYGDDGAGYTTALKLMQIMHGKGLLTRDDSQRSHVYAPAQKQESLRTGLLLDLIHKAFAGSGKELVMAALRDGHVTRSEREEIRKLLQKEDAK